MTGGEVSLRPYWESDLMRVVRLYRNSVIEIGPQEYSPQKVEIWASYPDDIDGFNSILLNGVTYVTETKDGLVSFGTLNPLNHLAYLYTIKEYSRRGIATSIYIQLEKHAVNSGILEIHTEASKIAGPFFLKQGFKIVEEEIVIRKGVEFERFKMTKKLAY